MKKKGLFILLGLICIAVVGGSGALFITRDKTGPKIIDFRGPEDSLQYR